MRKILLPVFAGLFVSLVACNTGTTVAGISYSSQAQKNLDVSHQIDSAFTNGNTAVIDSLFAPDFVDHGDRGDIKGTDSLKSMVNYMHANFTDMKSERIREWADNDYAVNWMRYTGNSKVASPGMPAGPFEFKEMEVSRFVNGKVVEHWTFIDAQTMAQIMKNMGMNMNMNNMDSASMRHMDSARMNMTDTSHMRTTDTTKHKM